MPAPTPDIPEQPDPQQVIGKAVQDLTAARLGKGFLPLGILAVGGLGHALYTGVWSAGALGLLFGAPLTAAAMLAYGLRGVQHAFGRPQRPWMYAAMAGSLLPLCFSVYVLAWRGLRGLARGGESADYAVAILFTLVGVWLLRSWMALVEVERLARAMASDIEEGRRSR